MSALRAHFSSATSQRSNKPTTQGGSTSARTPSEDGYARQPSKLAKKSFKLTSASQAAQRSGRRPVNASSSLPATQSRMAATPISQLRDQTMLSGPPSRDVLSPPPTHRTPSLVSGSSVSTFDSPRLNVLRRKPSTIAKFVASKRSDAHELDRSTMRSRNEYYTEAMDDSVFGIAMPSSGITPSTTPYSIANSDSLYTTASAAISNTPSTRYTDSPFSHVPTPSSFSSQSTVPMGMKDGSKLSQEIGRDATISPVEAMRQEKASRRTSMIPARQPSTGSNVGYRSAHLAAAYDTQAGPGRFQKVVDSGQKNVPSMQGKDVRRSINPPELAHLDALSPKKQNAPARPSREGAAGLNIAQPASPVIHSDIPPATFHKRTSSRDSIASSSSPGFRGRFGLSPKPSSSHRGSPHIANAMSPAGSDAGSAAALSEERQRANPRQPNAPMPSASPALAKTIHFGFLSRKSKDEASKTDKPKREARKMPTAGTGHERYGRFGFGPRNGSVSPSVGGRSPSIDSVSSNKSSSMLRRKSSTASEKTSELDEFLRDRLNPVVLRGGRVHHSPCGAVGSAAAALDNDCSDTSLGLTSSSTTYSRLPPSKAAISPPTASELSRAASAKPSLTAFNSEVQIRNDNISDIDPDQDDIASDVLEITEGKEGVWLQSLVQEKKPARKWNFLQRLQSSPVKSRQVGGAMSPPPATAASHRMNFDNAAHSALMDAIKPIDLDEVEKLVHEDDPAPSTVRRAVEEDRRRSLLPSPMGMDKRIKNRFSLLPAVEAQQARAALPEDYQLGQRRAEPSRSIKPEQQQQATLHTPELGRSESPRIPRLSPVGRIPRVVSQRDRDRKLPDVSFSRPFVNTQPRPNVKPPGALYNQIRELASPVESSAQDFPSTQSSQQPFTSAQNKRSSRGEYALRSAANLFSFPPRKTSEVSYCSSSDSASWMAYSRMQALQDEDVWNEYDDLMDDAALGKPSVYHKVSFSSHQSPPFREATAMQDASYFGLPPTREPSHALPRPPKVSRENSSSNVSQAGQQSMYSLTRAVLSRNSAMSGTSSISARSQAASFGEPNIRSSHTSYSSNARMNGESGQARGGGSSMLDGMHDSVNLKLEALMTSKLLSFGRVLFSPAHNEMRLSDEPRVLILDGLGSDWSYFVAMFYPQATIYNLGPSGKSSSNNRDGVQQLSNHRNISHSAIGAPLPFPKGFFTAAVFRFPVATTDPAYHSCVAEFKRVLRPGGYLEVSVLDIDLGNAGSLGRKAVRGLKTRLQQREENISLRSLSDFILQSIGKRGFEEVQRCVIGVPVMCRGGSNSSDAGSVSSSEEGPSKSSHRASDAQGQAFAKLVENAQQENAVDESSDEKMTKSVARVGRWWYSQCYERQVLSTDQSIWADNALLSECQQQGTSFRLLICYAQKPTQARRRTMSV